ncbi:MAG: DUF192 domain-containing protein [Bdellovibrionaceae bacterium]|nr:DUF192 domain-containing protein [Pseudobdellovibrionaceae bacterium]
MKSTSQLFNQTQNFKIASNVEIADNFYTRAKGLMGRKSLEPQSVLWIKKCTHIHTFFMRFSIDLIFVDRELNVKKVYSNAKPWCHFFLGTWKSDSVFELPFGTLNQLQICVGDQLYVGN